MHELVRDSSAGDVDALAVQPEMLERAAVQGRGAQVDMLLQAEQRAEFQGTVAVGETGQIVSAFLQQADKLARIKMLKREDALRCI